MDSELRVDSVLGFQRGRELKLDLGFQRTLLSVSCWLLAAEVIVQGRRSALSRGCNHTLWFWVRGDAGASLVMMVTAGS